MVAMKWNSEIQLWCIPSFQRCFRFAAALLPRLFRTKVAGHTTSIFRLFQDGFLIGRVVALPSVHKS